MCQKQCRDENGFKCHLNSESHKRQMEIFGQNAERVIQGYSEEFEADFMELMRRSHPRARVAAKNVYNEFIADKYHVHMNSTKWFTLTEFVKYLGKTGNLLNHTHVRHSELKLILDMTNIFHDVFRKASFCCRKMSS